MPHDHIDTASVIRPSDEVVEWRRHLHRHPELAYREHETGDFIASLCSSFGLEVHRGLAGTGVVATLARGTNKKAIGIRADMDALPIVEKTGVSYASEIPEVMHACGHDGHMAVLLGAARACAQMHDLDGTVHFIFQPAEENEGGGKRMVEEGLFDLFPCDEIYGLHNWPTIPAGTYAVRSGIMMAAFAVFEIEISGRGCHGAAPHQGQDVLLAASHIHTAIQAIVSRSMSPSKPGVVSVTQINGGTTWNILPDTCTLRGTTRWLDDETGDLIERRLSEVAKAVAMSFGCEAAVYYDRRIPATVNEAATVGHIKDAARQINGLTLVDEEPSMVAEDFAFMLNVRRGAYLFLGSGKGPNDPGLHSPRFDFNDDVIPVGIELWTTLVRDRLRATTPK